VLQLLIEQRQTFEADMTREMLEAAKTKCFTRCFNDGTGSFASATPLAGATTSTQQTCMTNCLDKFLEARTIIFKKTMKQTPRA
jgi:hypothetical protein